MPIITTQDGHELFYKDWGEGPVVTFSHGWPLNSDAWSGQMLFLVQNGFRVIAHDRRGHGKSAQTATRNDMDGYADDLAQLFDALDLREIAMVGHSTGGGEVARYIGRHGTGRVAKAVLLGAVPPVMVRSASNPDGLPIELFDGMRRDIARNRSQFFRDFAVPFYGANRPGNDVPQSLLDSLWLQAMTAGLTNAYDCIRAFSETDFTEDLRRFDIQTLIAHGEDDQIVPIHDSAHKAAKIIPHAQTLYYADAPHGLTETHADRFNTDLLAFLRS